MNEQIVPDRRSIPCVAFARHPFGRIDIQPICFAEALECED